MVCGPPPEGLHNAAVIESFWRFTEHTPSLNTRSALDAGIRFWLRRRRRNGHNLRLDDIASVGGFGGVSRRKAADGQIGRLGFGRESGIIFQPRQATLHIGPQFPDFLGGCGLGPYFAHRASSTIEVAKSMR